MIAFRLIAGCLLLAAACPLPAAQSPGSGGDAVLREQVLTQGYQLGQPRQAQLSRDGQVVSFLRSTATSPVQRLYLLDVASGQTRLLASPELLTAMHGEEVVSAEERARRERRRISARGLTDYALSGDGQQVLLGYSGQLFLLDVENGRPQLLTEGEQGRFSPDGERIAFLRAGALFVRELGSGRERQLSPDASESRSYGAAEFIAQEEMRRYEGYWFSPDSQSLAYTEVDNSGVERITLTDPARPWAAPRRPFYPRAGTHNAQVRLGVVAVEGGRTRWLRWDAEQLPYLLRVHWQGRAPLSLLLQSRDQREQVVAIHTGKDELRRLLTQSDTAWHSPDIASLAWLPDGSGFVAATEAGDGPQLMLYGRDGQLRQKLVDAGQRFFRLVGITGAGDIHVLATPSPTEVQLLRLRADITGRYGPAEALRAGLGERGVRLSEGSGHVLVTEAGLHTPTVTTLYSPSGQALAVLPSEALTPPSPQVQLLTLDVDGLAMPAAVIRPRNFDPGKRYPLVNVVYAGPTANRVVASQQSYLLDQWLADQGMVVVKIDTPGTPRQGRDWSRVFTATASKPRSMLAGIVAHQAAATRALLARLPELDANRVGITGWSYGGTVSAGAVMLAPELFKVAVAGAPVTDWADYDTHYSERYLGLPQENPAGYAADSLVALAPRLTRPLLLIHGTDDDNVLFSHSLKLADALMRAGRPFELLPLLKHSHLVSDPDAQAARYQRTVEFLQRTLGGPEPRQAGE